MKHGEIGLLAHLRVQPTLIDKIKPTYKHDPQLAKISKVLEKQDCW